MSSLIISYDHLASSYPNLRIKDWSNGEILTFGASADGIGSLQTPVHNPAWLGAQYIAWCPANVYDILFSGGAYKQKTTEDWYVRHLLEILDCLESRIDSYRLQFSSLRNLKFS